MNDEPKLPALTSGAPIRSIIPTTFEEVWRMANAVCVANMQPDSLDTPEKCTIAILHGLELGMPPMMALQSIAVINGRPTIWGDGALGLVQSSGKVVTIKEWQEGEGDARVAICRAVRINDPEPKIGRFSVSDAKTAMLWGKTGRSGQPTPWVTYPERMLKMRARAWCLRDGFADVLKGLAIAEEIRDIVIEHDARETPKKQPPVPTEPVEGKQAEKQPEPAKDKEKPVEKKPPVPPEPDEREMLAREGTESGTATAEASEQVVNNGEEMTVGELLDEFDTALASAKTVEDVQTIWNDYDLLARLESLPDGQEFQGLALGLKRKHVMRVKGNG